MNADSSSSAPLRFSSSATRSVALLIAGLFAGGCGANDEDSSNGNGSPTEPDGGTTGSNGGPMDPNGSPTEPDGGMTGPNGSPPDGGPPDSHDSTPDGGPPDSHDSTPDGGPLDPNDSTPDGGPPPTPVVTTVTAVEVSDPGEDLDCERTSVQLLAIVEGEGAPPEDVTWSTSDAQVAGVDATGLVTARGLGTATIFATSDFDTSITGSVTVSVVEPLHVYVDADAELGDGSPAAPFTTLAEAVDAVCAGGIVQLAPGTYPTDLAVNKPVAILGPNAGVNPNLQTRGPEATLVPAASGATNIVYLLDDGITVDGLTFDGANPDLEGGTEQQGVTVHAYRAVWMGANDLRFENNRVHNFNAAYYTLNPSFPAEGRYDLRVLDNHFENIGGPFVMIGNVSAEFSGNVVENSFGGFSIRDLTPAASASLRIIGNTFSHIQQGIDIVRVEGEHDLVIEDNSVDSSQAGMLINDVFPTEPLVIRGGTFTRNDTGILVFNSLDGSIEIVDSLDVSTRHPMRGASFGPRDPNVSVTAEVTRTSPANGCSELTDPGTIAGKVAMIDRGACTFITKVLYAQEAGAVAVIIANHEDALTAMSGSDDESSVTIPSVLVASSSASAIDAAIASGGATATVAPTDLPSYFQVEPGGSRVVFEDVEAVNATIAGIRVHAGEPSASFQITIQGGSELRDGAWGVISEGPGLNLRIRECTIRDNYRGGVRARDSVVDARSTYWGAASGPGGGVSDPTTSRVANGAGDDVTESVRFDPFLEAAP